MNIYSKYAPNVFLAKCPEMHQKGDVIPVTTKYGKENDCIVFNLIKEQDNHYYYSIVRDDGFNFKEWVQRKADKLQNASFKAQSKSNDYWKASNKDSNFLSLGEPIKIGHHSEKRHRKIIEQAQNNMSKSVEFSNKADDLERRAEYWENKEDTMNLSMPECLEYYELELEKAMIFHQGLKDGTIERRHSYSLTYANKAVNELEKKIKLAHKLWGDNNG